MKFFNILSVSLFALSALFFGASQVGAETSFGIAESASCFDYYRFQSVQVSMGTAQDSYAAGSIIPFSGTIENQNPYPVVDGNVFVRISRVNPNYVREGHQIVDELVPLSGISLAAGEAKRVNFIWQSPTALPAGEYRADYFYSVGKKFNLGGLPFSNEVIIGSTPFRINTSLTKGVMFDRAGTTVNGTPYQQIGNWPILETGKSAIISQVIKNTTGETKQVEITYDLYFWDSLNETDKIASKTETVTLAKQGNATLTYVVPSATESVYYLKMTARSGDAKSIVNVRFATNANHPRLNYPALAAFPLTKGATTTLFACYHNAGLSATEGAVEVTLSDKNGTTIESMRYQGAIPPMMSAVKRDFIPAEEYGYVALSARITDASGKVIDQYQAVYDCSLVESTACARFVEKERLARMVWPLLAVTLALIVLALALRYRRLRMLIAIVFAFTVFGSSHDAFAYNQKTVTSYSQYTFQSNGKPNQCHSDNRLIAFGDLSVLHKVDMTAGNTTVTPGSAINFAYSPDAPFFNAYGGLWDTPYGEWYVSDTQAKTNTITKGQHIYDNVSGSTNDGWVYWTATKPTVSISSSNSSVVSCSGMNCTAKAAGTVTLTANIAQTPSKIWVYEKQKLVQGGTNTYRWASIDFPYLASGYNSYNINNGCTGSYVNTMNLPSATVSWTVTVTAVAPMTLSPSGTLACGTTQTNLSWSAYSGATSYNVRVDDTTANPWNGSCSSPNAGDLCQNGLTSLSYSNYPVQAGHVYSFWVDTNNGYSTSTTFSVPSSASCSSPSNLPTVSLSANPGSVTSGSSSTLTWTTGNTPDSCTASGGWSGPKSPAGSSQSTGALTSQTTFTITCQKVISGTTYYATSSVTVGINSNQGQGVPTVDLKVGTTTPYTDGPISVNLGDAVTLSWTTTGNPTFCEASDGSPGWDISPNSRSTGPTASWLSGALQGAYQYDIACGNANGTSSDSVIVNINGHTCTDGGYWPDCYVPPDGDTFTIIMNPGVVQKGGKCQITWSVASGLNLCYLSGGEYGAQGAKLDLSNNPGSTTTLPIMSSAPVVYTLTCGGPSVATTSHNATCSVYTSFQEQ